MASGMLISASTTELKETLRDHISNCHCCPWLALYLLCPDCLKTDRV